MRPRFLRHSGMGLQWADTRISPHPETPMTYTPDPSTAESPLRDEEVDALLRGETPRDLTKPRNLAHLLSRVAATMKMQMEERRRLHNEIAAIRTQKAYEGGMPTTLRPGDAMRYMSLAERAEHTEATTREYLALLGRTIDQLEASRQVLVRSQHAARLAAERLVETGELAAPAANELRALLAILAGARPAVEAAGPQLDAARAQIAAAAPPVTHQSAHPSTNPSTYPSTYPSTGTPSTDPWAHLHAPQPEVPR